MPRKLILCVIALLALPIAPQAAQVAGSCSAIFINPSGPDCPHTEGVGSDYFIWGLPGNAQGAHPGQCHLQFVGTNGFAANTGTDFVIGTLNYENLTTSIDPCDSSADRVSLRVTVNFTSPVNVEEFEYALELINTLNDNVSPLEAQDYVKWTNAVPSHTFRIGNTRYTLELTGFHYPGGTTVGEFHVFEGRSTTAELWAKITALQTPTALTCNMPTFYCGDEGSPCVILKDESDDPVVGATVHFSVVNGPSLPDGVTDTNGRACSKWTPSLAGSYAIHCVFDGDSGQNLLGTYTDCSVTVDHDPTVVTPSPSAANSSDKFSLRACLKDDEGIPLANRTIYFDLAGQRYLAQTDSGGCAEATDNYLCLPSAVHPFTASFGGDDCYAASSGGQNLTITCDPTNITDDTAKDHIVDYSDPIVLGAWLKDNERLQLTGKPLKFTVGTQSCTDFTGPGGAAGCKPDNDLTGRDGYASCSITVNQPVSSPACTPITSGISFAGDESYCTSSTPIGVQIECENARIQPLWKLPIGCDGPNGDGFEMKLDAYVIEREKDGTYDGSYGDITKAGPIWFDVYDYTGKLLRTESSNLAAVPNPDPAGPPVVGYAEVTIPQIVGIYCVYVRQQAGNCYYCVDPSDEVTTVVNCQRVAPVKGGVPQIVDLNPDVKLLYDKNTGSPITDPFSRLQATQRTWINYMFFATPCQLNKPVHLQTVKFEKLIPERKVSCGAGWTTAPTTVLQQGIQDIQTRWPLAYEVDGTELKLTVIYTTDQRLAYPSPFPPNISARTHVETFRWIVTSNTWEAFYERLGYFANTPAGTCETIGVTPTARMKIATFTGTDPVYPTITGYGSPALGNYIPGIDQYVQAGKPVEASARFAALEEYMDLVCADHCGGLYTSGPNIGTPSPVSPGGDAILDNPTAPATSLLFNDLWAVGRKLNVLGGK